MNHTGLAVARTICQMRSQADERADGIEVATTRTLPTRERDSSQQCSTRVCVYPSRVTGTRTSSEKTSSPHNDRDGVFPLVNSSDVHYCCSAPRRRPPLGWSEVTGRQEDDMANQGRTFGGGHATLSKRNKGRATQYCRPETVRGTDGGDGNPHLGTW